MLKFKLKQKVWVIHNGKAEAAFVVCRQYQEQRSIHGSSDNETKVYDVTIGPDPDVWHKYPEDQVFATKEELIASL